MSTSLNYNITADGFHYSSHKARQDVHIWWTPKQKIKAIRAINWILKYEHSNAKGIRAIKKKKKDVMANTTDSFSATNPLSTDL